MVALEIKMDKLKEEEESQEKEVKTDCSTLCGVVWKEDVKWRQYIKPGLFEMVRAGVRDIVSPIRLSGGMNKSIPPDGINRYRVSPLKLKLDIKHKMLMLNICNVNV